MSSLTNCQYVSYRLSGLPVGALGETYLIATAIMESEYSYRCEYFLVSKRNNSNLHSEAYVFELDDTTEELLDINAEFLIDEAKRQAEIYIEDQLFQIAENKGRPIPFDVRIEFLQMKYMPLHGLWMRGELHEETKAIAQATKCDQLKLYLDVLTRSSSSRRPG